MSITDKLVKAAGEGSEAITDALSVWQTIKDVAGNETVLKSLSAITVGGVAITTCPALAVTLGCVGFSAAIAIYKQRKAQKTETKLEECRQWLDSCSEKINHLLQNDRDMLRAAEAMAKAEQSGNFEDLEPDAYGTAAVHILTFKAFQHSQKDHPGELERLLKDVSTKEDVEVLTTYVEASLRGIQQVKAEFGQLHTEVTHQTGILKEIRVQGQKTNEELIQINLQQGRRIDCLMAIVSRLSGSDSKDLTQEEKVELAYIELAKVEGVDVEELKASVHNYAETVRRNPHASYLDQARADYANALYEQAADNAALAAKAARIVRLAAEEKQKKATVEEISARDSEREALIFLGRSCQAVKKYAEACAAFRKALEITTESENAAAWAAICGELGVASCGWAQISEGLAIPQHFAEAVAAFREALKVYTRQAFPQDWAKTQNNLGATLLSLAATSEGQESEQFLTESVTAILMALEVRTRDSLPQNWAATQNNLGNALSALAANSVGAERTQLLAGAVAAYRNALKVYTRQAFPQDWAQTLNNLGITLVHLAADSEGAERAQLLAEAVTACREALTFFTLDTLPQDWAGTHNNLGLALVALADASDGAERTQLLSEAVAAFRKAFKVFTSKTLPQNWAMTQNNLGIALSNQATASEGPERARLLTEAIAAFREALTVYTHKHFPRHYQIVQQSLLPALYQLEIVRISTGVIPRSPRPVYEKEKSGQ